VVVTAADPGDDRGQGFGQFRADNEQPFPVGLGRCDLQQRDHLAGAGQRVGDEAAVSEFEHLPDPHGRMAQDLDARPCPEGDVLRDQPGN
jgi:hypothetical protein